MRMRKSLSRIGDLREVDESLDYVLKKLIYFTSSSTSSTVRNYVVVEKVQVIHETELDDTCVCAIAHFMAKKLICITMDKN